MTVRVISDGFSANLHPFGGLAGCVSSCSPNCLAVANRGGVLDVLLDGGGPFGADDAGSAGAKLQRGRTKSRASRSPALVGEVDCGDDVLARRFGRYQRFEVVEHQLGAGEHRECAVVADVAPSQIDESFSAAALHCRPSEVDARVAFEDVDLRLPDRGLAVAGNQFNGLWALLDADMDVVARAALEVPGPAGEVVSTDLEQHTTMMPARARCDPEVGSGCGCVLAESQVSVLDGAQVAGCSGDAEAEQVAEAPQVSAGGVDLV